jgi:hypothetical protein
MTNLRKDDDRGCRLKAAFPDRRLQAAGGSQSATRNPQSAIE